MAACILVGIATAGASSIEFLPEWQGSWVGDVLAGAGQTDEARDSSISCVSGSGDVLVGNQFVTVRESTLEISGAKLEQFQRNSIQYFRKPVAFEIVNPTAFNNGVSFPRAENDGWY